MLTIDRSPVFALSHRSPSRVGTSIDGHAIRLRCAGVVEVRHFHPIRDDGFLIFALHLPMGNVWFQSFVEVDRTGDGVDDGRNDADYGKNGKRGEGLSRGPILLRDPVVLIHADEFEEKVGEAGKV